MPRGRVGQLGRCSRVDSQTSSRGCGRDHHCPRSRPQLSVNHSCPGFQGMAGKRQVSRCQVGRRWRRAQDRIDQTQRRPALMLPEAAPMVAEPFSSVPTSGETRFLLLLRRSVFLLLTICRFRCGCLLDVIGHRHSWEAWVCIGVSRRKGVRTNVFVRELDHHPGQNRFDDRRWEVVDGLEFFNVAKLAVDTTLVSVLRVDGTGSRKGVTVGGEAFRKSQGTKGENSFRTRWSPLKIAVHISVVAREKITLLMEKVMASKISSWSKGWKQNSGWKTSSPTADSQSSQEQWTKADKKETRWKEQEVSMKQANRQKSHGKESQGKPEKGKMNWWIGWL